MEGRGEKEPAPMIAIARGQLMTRGPAASPECVKLGLVRRDESRTSKCSTVRYQKLPALKLKLRLSGLLPQIRALDIR